ncbi:cache domain-containing protein [Aureivirga sp. CE67]|uniref:cache domain-containing protein n=1 Tax=Aureivirga sp. CE67 TaxID=1788983 RepID=UPI0018CA2323|nr:cache domain-containing protein [Aureivirga sp. CE67]
MKRIFYLLIFISFISCIDDDDPAFEPVDFCPNYQICLKSSQIETLQNDLEKTRAHFDFYSTAEIVEFFKTKKEENPFLFILDSEGNVLIDNHTPYTEGQNLYESIDRITGSYYIQDIINSTSTLGENNWTSHFAENPSSEKLQQIYAIVSSIEKDGEKIIFGNKNFVEK